MQPLEIACRHTDHDGTNCAAQAGKPCIWLSVYGQRYEGQIPHPERIEDAVAMSTPAANADPELLDEAFEAVLDQIT